MSSYDLFWPHVTFSYHIYSSVLLSFLLPLLIFISFSSIFINFHTVGVPYYYVLRSIIFLFHMTSFDLMWLFSITYTLSSLWKNLLALSGIEPEPFMYILAQRRNIFHMAVSGLTKKSPTHYPYPFNLKVISQIEDFWSSWCPPEALLLNFHKSSIIR